MIDVNAVWKSTLDFKSSLSTLRLCSGYLFQAGGEPPAQWIAMKVPTFIDRGDAADMTVRLWCRARR